MVSSVSRDGKDQQNQTLVLEPPIEQRRYHVGIENPAVKKLAVCTMSPNKYLQEAGAVAGKL